MVLESTRWAQGKAAYAEANRMVLLFPQSSVAGAWGSDCWDWAGAHTGAAFDTHSGVQIGAVVGMVQDLEALLRRGTPVPGPWPPPLADQA